MKNNLFAFFALILMTSFSFAQQKGQVEAGLNIGLNFSNITDNDYYSSVPTNTRLAFNIGGSAEYYFSDRWGIKAKLIYDRKGWADDLFYYEDPYEEFITDYALDYITIPVMADFHFGRARNWYVNFGPYIGFLTSATVVDPDVDIKELINKEDFGLAFGGGYKFLINEHVKMFFEIDHQAGLDNIFEDGRGTSITNGRTSVNTGLLFLLY
ncbi:Outer membrane protein beta-barrel domain-containing protein [Flavobacteriaceae bacterium MAR_2010_188]|nr:Outer membrane protein beta-barrel domain-containing protein [Flavobacteriaceae bacterium MAR_2010_188]